MVSAVLDLTRNDIRHSTRAGLLDLSKDAPDPSSLLADYAVGHMTADEAEEFYKRLQALAEDFPALRAQEEVGEEHRAYRLLITLFPTTSHTPSSS